MLSIGIVGLPNVGKSTLFNAITKNSVPALNYPFCTIDPSVGIVPVPDERLAKLKEISNSEKVIPAIVEFTDIAGLVKGASVGEGLGNKFLANIREVNAIAQVVRIFKDENITHVHGEINPLSDIEIINLELILADQATVTKRLSNLERDVKRNDKNAIIESDVLKKVLNSLDDGRMANSTDLSDDEKTVITGMHLLSIKPMMYVLNYKSDGDNLKPGDPEYDKLINFLEESGAEYVFVDASFEHQVMEMSDDEKNDFRLEISENEIPENKLGLSNLIIEAYELLNYITYLTTGEKETRAWTTIKGSTAPIAGTAIHTDFKDKFIRAEVISYVKLVEAGSFAVARERGWFRIEGKEYIVKDGDVIEFKI